MYVLKPYDNVFWETVNIQKFGIGKSIFMFLKEVSCAHQGCIYLIRNALKSNIVKYYYNLK